MDGVQKLIDRGQRLDELVRKTQTLQIMVNRTKYFVFSEIHEVQFDPAAAKQASILNSPIDERI